MLCGHSKEQLKTGCVIKMLPNVIFTIQDIHLDSYLWKLFSLHIPMSINAQTQFFVNVLSSGKEYSIVVLLLLFIALKVRKYPVEICRLNGSHFWQICLDNKLFSYFLLLRLFLLINTEPFSPSGNGL